jgi:neutral ceramidase
MKILAAIMWGVLAGAGSAFSAAETSGLRIGIGASVTTPFLDEPMAGYYYERFADGVHDELFAKTLLFDDGGNRVVLVACDLVRIPQRAVHDARQRIQTRYGIPPTHVMISATHSHTGPQTTPEYLAFLARKIADSVGTAIGQAKPARLLLGMGEERSLPHNRRYRMTDGSIVTNPGFLNPAIVEPVGPIDPRVPVLVVEGERGPIATWVNYAMHLDTVGSTWISSDYPYFMGRLLARVRGADMMTIFTIGAAGDINHWDVRRPGPQRGFDEARRIGEVLAAAVLKATTELTPVEVTGVRAVSSTVELPVPTVSEGEVTAMRRVLATPPPKDVDFTLDRVRAARIIAQGGMAGKPIAAEIQVIVVGQIAFVGIPGELFVELGLQIQQASPFRHTFIIEQANDTIGYIPTRAAFEQGGYEPTAARIAPGGGELIVAKALELLRGLTR